MTNATKIIGLTGNIATGKSVVRRMMSNSGGLGIDADFIAHRMLYPGGPAYEDVIAAFGEDILLPDQQISRRKLGKIVFGDPEKLTQLESLVHPPVTESILQRIHRAQNPFVVIEAIKLIEAGLVDICDAVWVSHTTVSIQLERLIQTRHLSETEANNRIYAQPPQSEKVSKADQVINTEGAFKDTWYQVQRRLNDTIHSKGSDSTLNLSEITSYSIKHASLVSEQLLEDFWLKHAGEDLHRLYETLGMNMLLPVFQNDRLAYLIIWENWNFTAALNRIIPAPPDRETASALFAAFERQAQAKQSEVLLLNKKTASKNAIEPAVFGFEQRKPEGLAYPAWQSAVNRIGASSEKPMWTKIIAEPVELNGNIINGREQSV